MANKSGGTLAQGMVVFVIGLIAIAIVKGDGFGLAVLWLVGGLGLPVLLIRYLLAASSRKTEQQHLAVRTAKLTQKATPTISSLPPVEHMPTAEESQRDKWCLEEKEHLRARQFGLYRNVQLSRAQSLLKRQRDHPEALSYLLQLFVLDVNDRDDPFVAPWVVEKIALYEIDNKRLRAMLSEQIEFLSGKVPVRLTPEGTWRKLRKAMAEQNLKGYT